MKLLSRCVFLSLLVYGSIPLFAQKPAVNIYWITRVQDAANTILYNPANKLTIDDFKGKPSEASNAVAITASGFMFTSGFRSEGDKASLDIGVYCSFNKKESWMKERGKNAYILEHEQRHFDISYLCTLQFVDELKQAKFTKDNYQEQVKQIYTKVVKNLEAMQQKYDAETNNGINKEKQEEWNVKLSALLAHTR